MACVATAGQATTAYNSTPADGWFYGNGNDYSPANTAVLTTNTNDQLYLRWHKTFEVAPASNGKVYSFTLGTEPMSFDWGIDNNAGSPITAALLIQNLGTGQSVSYNPFFVGNDNTNANGSSQNSARLSFAFLSGVGFDSNVDDTYRVTLKVVGLASGPQALSIDAKLGAGVPEPATWAMMIGGFGFVGGALRSRRRATPRLA
jgi:hypothetical protein